MAEMLATEKQKKKQQKKKKSLKIFQETRMFFSVITCQMLYFTASDM